MLEAHRYVTSVTQAQNAAERLRRKDFALVSIAATAGRNAGFQE
jgi:hypothetical protein